MKFVIQQEDLNNGIKIVENAASTKALQPVLLNILIETIGTNAIRLVATDLDLTIITEVDAQVEAEGKITLPSKTLNEIVSKLGNKLITFEKPEDSSTVNITCQKSKFDIIGISANEFPPEVYNVETKEEESFTIEVKPLTKAAKKAGFAAASYESSNLLSGIVCSISGETLEIASTDGNRLARVREKISNTENNSRQLIIPARTMNEFNKISAYIKEDSVKIYAEKTKMIIKSEKVTMISRLLDGQYPKYEQLIPPDSPKNIVVNKNELLSALDRVAIMVDAKTSIVKFDLRQNQLLLTADTSNSGKSEEELAVEYSGEDMVIAFNHKYVQDALKNIECDDVKIGMNTSLSATVFKPNCEEDFVCLIMPVQIRQ